jgi:hypothetical protein
MGLVAHLFPNGWEHYLVGGVSIGLGVGLLFALTGLIGGISTAYTAVWSLLTQHPFFQHEKFVSTRNWRLMYGVGLIVGAAAFTYTLGHGQGFVTRVPLWQLFIGGVVGGFGSRMGGGCTSGHGICGVASLQLPSMLAVVIFLTTAIITAHVVRALGGF